MEYTEQEHKEQHNSFNNPVADCEYCQHEIFRRTHRCMGDGASTVPIPKPATEEQ